MVGSETKPIDPLLQDRYDKGIVLCSQEIADSKTLIEKLPENLYRIVRPDFNPEIRIELNDGQIIKLNGNEIPGFQLDETDRATFDNFRYLAVFRSIPNISFRAYTDNNIINCLRSGECRCYNSEFGKTFILDANPEPLGVIEEKKN